ncbi:MAG: sugar transferase [Planctomycetes bacterium]|nr:sugar transferase [Planctomycetota bacterium]
MKLIIIHRNGHLPLNSGKQANLQSSTKSNSCNLLQFATCTKPLSDITFSCLNGNSRKRSNNEVIAIPEEWRSQSAKIDANLIYYEKNLPVPSRVTSKLKANSWFTVSNGRYVTHIDNQLLSKILDQSQDDVIAINVVPQLQAFHEKVLITSKSKLVGFRRLYSDSAQLSSIPNDWPQYLFIRTDVLNKLLVDNALPLAFSMFIDACSAHSLTVRSLNVGGTVLDLEVEKDLLGLLAIRLNTSAKNLHNSGNGYQNQFLPQDSITISQGARLFGKVLFGQNINIGQNVTIIGPTIIGSGVKVAKGVVIKTSIIAPDVSIPRNNIIQNRILVGPQFHLKHHRQQNMNSRTLYNNSYTSNFRIWPRFSYARCFKRIADVIAAILVLVLFAPIVPIIALVIKLTSPGPIFFKDTRQGLHGKVFNCLKFRSMLTDANKMQDKLRVLNQADGPQFKMTNDPRLSIVGKFLRDTYIDEIPQFFNVLLGQMSVVGPRPSPESENTSCPSWRDARLSVRPGITGLWQVRRTRQPMKDFQEWIHYDIKYVKNLSLKTDLWICWQTAKKMAKNFINQF